MRRRLAEVLPQEAIIRRRLPAVDFGEGIDALLIQLDLASSDGRAVKRCEVTQ
jgi:hypothetical protein